MADVPSEAPEREYISSVILIDVLQINLIN